MPRNHLQRLTQQDKSGFDRSAESHTQKPGGATREALRTRDSIQSLLSGNHLAVLQIQKARGSMRGSPELLAWRSRLELLESASPIAFAEHPHFYR